MVDLFSGDVIVDAQDAREADRAFQRLQRISWMSLAFGLFFVGLLLFEYDQPLMAIMVTTVYAPYMLYFLWTIRRNRRRALAQFVNPVTGRIELPQGPIEPRSL